MSNPRVAILMGSDSDLPVMRKAAAALDEFGVPYRMTISSAHRTPEAVKAYIRKAEDDGVGVFIAAAGMAAHLAGAVAGMTTRPVIGVPLTGKLAGGLDSLLSTVQMPPGVPVATVAVDGAKNAAVLAVQMLAISDAALADKMNQYKKDMADAVMKKAEALNAELASA
jgi:5-(carboxyamino)imidazole ribonucleotide mutase